MANKMIRSELIARLKPKLTDEFLATLTEYLKIEGWGVDYCEAEDFVRSCYSLADKDAPNLSEYEFEVGEDGNYT